MNLNTDRKVLNCLDRWTNAEIEHSRKNVISSIEIEVFESPKMTPIEQIVFFSLREHGVTVTPQKIIGKYRVDFLIETTDGPIVIECDGHDFHEKTKEQAQNDKARDRNLQAAGFRVYRFTGSEIWKTEGKCLFDVINICTI